MTSRPRSCPPHSATSPIWTSRRKGVTVHGVPREPPEAGFKSNEAEVPS